MKMYMITGIVILLTGGAMMFGIAAAEELKVGDAAPDFTLPGSDGKTCLLYTSPSPRD